MALVLIKEDGTGKMDANWYADITDGNAYFEGHFFASAWTESAPDEKEAVLVMATRLIDSMFQFNGWKVNDRQALQWPRWKCPDPDGGLAVIPIRLLPRGLGYVDLDIVPTPVINATCEMARELVLVDRTAAPPGEGISATQNTTASHDATGGTSSSSSISYSKGDTRPIISHVAKAMLSRWRAHKWRRWPGAVGSFLRKPMKRRLIFLMVLYAGITLGQQVKLAWDASPSPGVAGYRIYYGTNAGNYSFVTNAGLVWTQTVVLPRTGRWFFAATAVDTNDMESAFSNEVEWEAKPSAPALHGETWVRLTPVIERSTNLVNWWRYAGEATWLPATNTMEFFATRKLEIERVQRVTE